ncbi:MAG TPA: hypothetical protein VFF70_08520, partial [Anaerolineae bacterium]|nr:hypothetical protein [Anaerolineae bacterium]
MSDRKIYRWRRSIATLMLAAIGISVLVVNMPAARSISAHSTNLSPAVGSSYLYRFDPISQTWFT